jgi:hypothetical protein
MEKYTVRKRIERPTQRARPAAISLPVLEVFRFFVPERSSVGRRSRAAVVPIPDDISLFGVLKIGVSPRAMKSKIKLSQMNQDGNLPRKNNKRTGEKKKNNPNALSSRAVLSRLRM